MLTQSSQEGSFLIIRQQENSKMIICQAQFQSL